MEGGPDLLPQPVYLRMRQVIAHPVLWQLEEGGHDMVVPAPLQELEAEDEAPLVGQPQEDLMAMVLG